MSSNSNLNTPASQSKLKQDIDRIECLNDDKQVVQEEIKDIYTNLKSEGYDTKIIRKIVKLRKKAKHERDEEETLTDMYWNAIGDA